MEPMELANIAAEYLYTKMGMNIQVYSVAHLTSIADYFVLCSGKNAIQCRTMAEDLQEELRDKYNVEARRTEGAKESRWVVLDYGSVIVHVFHEQEREFYNIEKLWADGTNLVKAL